MFIIIIVYYFLYADLPKKTYFKYTQPYLDICSYRVCYKYVKVSESFSKRNPKVKLGSLETPKMKSLAIFFTKK